MEIKIGKFNPLKSDIFKYIITPAIGFGIGGAIWGAVLYKWSLGDSSPNPFSYIYGAIAIGLVGSTSLILFKSPKLFFKVSLLGTLGSLAGFLIAGSFSYYLFLMGRTFGPWVMVLGPETWDKISQLRPSLTIGDFWLVFALAGFFIGLLCARGIETKLLTTGLYSAAGFSFGSLIAPVIGNSSGVFTHSLFMSYLITFFSIGSILGLFLSFAVYRSENHRKKES